MGRFYGAMETKPPPGSPQTALRLRQLGGDRVALARPGEVVAADSMAVGFLGVDDEVPEHKNLLN